VSDRCKRLLSIRSTPAANRAAVTVEAATPCRLKLDVEPVRATPEEARDLARQLTRSMRRDDCDWTATSLLPGEPWTHHVHFEQGRQLDFAAVVHGLPQDADTALLTGFALEGFTVPALDEHAFPPDRDPRDDAE